MAAPHINLRGPVLYRIVRAEHPRTDDAWCVRPTYDFAHGQSDAIEGITHCICTLEFEDHRPLYDWLIDSLPVPSRARTNVALMPGMWPSGDTYDNALAESVSGLFKTELIRKQGP
jgi:glutamyl/glutaminyl-tRNA synthetase